MRARPPPPGLDSFTLTGRLAVDGQPVQAWLEVQDDDVVLHDFLASGRTRPDGTFDLRFSRAAFNQQPWEREVSPDLTLFVWHPIGAGERPAVEVPPSHRARFPGAVFRDGAADLGVVDLSAGSARRGAWLLRQLNTSRRPGQAWTLPQVQALTDEVLGWVVDVCRPVRTPAIEVRIEPLDDAVGSYSAVDRTLRIDPVFAGRLDQDGLRRLLAHELAHAVAHDAMLDIDQSVAVEVPEDLARWAEALRPLVPLSERELLTCVLGQAVTANHEGFAHYVEERIVRRFVPLSAYPLATLWDEARIEALDRQLDEGARRLWLAQHDAFALRQLGVAWYRARYGARRVRVRLLRSAGADLLAACMDRFDRIVRGTASAARAPRFEP